MKQSTTLTAFAAAFVSILTSFGVTIHDTHLDQLVARSETRPAIVAYREPDDQTPTKPLGSGQHAHVDYNPLSQSLSNTFAYQSPSIAPRRDSHHKQLLTQIEQGGRHAFDNANLPILD